VDVVGMLVAAAVRVMVVRVVAGIGAVVREVVAAGWILVADRADLLLGATPVLL
jgi:hypothetical protein